LGHSFSHAAALLAAAMLWVALQRLQQLMLLRPLLPLLQQHFILFA